MRLVKEESEDEDSEDEEALQASREFLSEGPPSEPGLTYYCIGSGSGGGGAAATY